MWGLEFDEAFDKLKSALTSAPILAYPKCDGGRYSGYAVGGILSQEQNG